jgi:ubiquinone biosynthesis monooxygenase Coq7
MLSRIDACIVELDRALRTLSGLAAGARATPGGDRPAQPLDEDERRQAAALMRVNHVGEVCAQALYQGQSLTARDRATREALQKAAREEQDHLAWCLQRIDELGGRPSLLNPLWYAGSLALGVVAGTLGDRWNLAFLAETERQVEEHLAGHLGRLPEQDARTRAIVEQMRVEEAGHRASATALGAAELPAPVKLGMRLMSRVMTGIAYHL